MPPAPKVPTAKLAEADIDKKIKELMISMDKLFTDEKALELSKNQYYTEYESRTTLYGQKCRLKDGALRLTLISPLPIKQYRGQKKQRPYMKNYLLLYLRRAALFLSLPSGKITGLMLLHLKTMWRPGKVN